MDKAYYVPSPVKKDLMIKLIQNLEPNIDPKMCKTNDLKTRKSCSSEEVKTYFEHLGQQCHLSPDQSLLGEVSEFHKLAAMKFLCQ